MYKIILASESPRRKEILDTMGIRYRCITANVTETSQETDPERLVQALAALKSEAVLDKEELCSEEYQEAIIIGADTMVFYQGQALGKPKDQEDAYRMLRMLSDGVHEVITGVSILIKNAGDRIERVSFAVCTGVYVLPLTDAQIRDYIETGEPMDKAGAYGIQGRFGMFIRKIDGDYYNVVGFPIAGIYETLLSKGIDIKKLT